LLNERGRATLAVNLKVYMRVRTWIFAVAVAGTAHLLEPAMVSARQAPATVSAPRIIEVVARRFEFEPSTIEVTEGDHIRLVVKSDDGVHGVEIKKFKVNKLIPRGGKTVTIDFVATAAGTFPILCSENCGEGHEDMTGSLVVHAKPK
jgi:cytochrome c oxidase subunit II